MEDNLTAAQVKSFNMLEDVSEGFMSEHANEVRLGTHVRLVANVRKLVGDMFKTMGVPDNEYDYQKCVDDAVGMLGSLRAVKRQKLANSASAVEPTHGGNSGTVDNRWMADGLRRNAAGIVGNNIGASNNVDGSSSVSLSSAVGPSSAPVAGIPSRLVSANQNAVVGSPSGDSIEDVIKIKIHEHYPRSSVPKKLRTLIEKYGLNLDLKPRTVNTVEESEWVHNNHDDELRKMVKESAYEGHPDPQKQDAIRTEVDSVFESPEVRQWFNQNLMIECDKNMGVCAISRMKWKSMVDGFIQSTTCFKKLDTVEIAKNLLSNSQVDTDTNLMFQLTKGLWTLQEQNLKNGRSKPKTIETLLEVLPNMRCTIKVHKNPVGIRPIVSMYNTLMTKVAMELDYECSILSDCLVGKNAGCKHMILNSRQALEFVASHAVGVNSLMTADFASLYTNIVNDHLIKTLLEYCRRHNIWTIDKKSKTVANHPYGERIDHTKYLSVRQFVGKLRASLRIAYFVYNDSVYLQRSGLPMGAHYAPKVANLYLQCMEWLWVEQNRQSLRLVRYIDDVLSTQRYNFREIYQMDESGLSLDPAQEGEAVDFLDLRIERKDDGNGWVSRWFL